MCICQVRFQLCVPNGLRCILFTSAMFCSRGTGQAEACGIRTAAAEVTPAQLKEYLTYPPEWGEPPRTQGQLLPASTFDCCGTA
jgi:hypothetical protein